MSRSGLLALGWVVLLLGLGGCGGVRTPTEYGEGDRMCLAELDRRGFDYWRTQVADAGGGCGIETAVEVSRMHTALSRPATMSCGLASRLDDFDREVVQAAAQASLGQAVTEINHFGSYACRGSTGMRGRLSQHALGQAIDVSGFRLADGTVISVERDWLDPGPKQQFLRQVAQQACQYFSVVLTPDSNADHYNHFHLDIGPDHHCPA